MAENMSPISGPVSDKSINGMVLNFIIPGLGLIIAGETVLGVIQLAMALVGIPLIFFHGFGVLMIIAAYIWSIVTGVHLMQKSTEPPRS